MCTPYLLPAISQKAHYNELQTSWPLLQQIIVIPLLGKPQHQATRRPLVFPEQGVLLRAQLLSLPQRQTHDEEQLQGPGKSPVQRPCEEVPGHPEGQLSEEVGMSAVLEKPTPQESGFVDSVVRPVGQGLLLGLLEVPLLLIRHGLDYDKQQGEPGEEVVLDLEFGVGYEVDRQDHPQVEYILVDSPEGDMVDHPEDLVLRVILNIPPSVILQTVVPALSPQIEGQPDSPQCDQRLHDIPADCPIVENVGIGDRGCAPHLIHDSEVVEDLVFYIGGDHHVPADDSCIDERMQLIQEGEQDAEGQKYRDQGGE